MPGARTHDIITVVTGAALVPLAYPAYVASLGADAAAGVTVCLIGAHLLSGIMFSPDLDLDSAIDNRWGPLFWIWRPYMWLIPHRRFWSHSLVVSPILRLLYFYAVLMLILVGGAWALAQVGVQTPDYHQRVTDAIIGLFRRHPESVRAGLLGFVTGSAAHTIADWLVTGGKRYLQTFGVRVRRDYSNHDRWAGRRGRART